MWRDILNIHPDCIEDFINFDKLPGQAGGLIACAGLSYLQTEYQIGKTGKGESFLGKGDSNEHVHYLISTHAGEGKIKFGNNQYLVHPGSIVLLPAGTPFLYELSGEYWDMCWLLLHDCSEYKFIHQRQPCVYASTNAERLYQTMSLIREFKHGESLYQADIILRLVEVLVFQIAQTLNMGQQLTKQQKKFHSLIQRVNKQLQLPWTVKRLAEEMHISEPHFFRLCKKEVGMTPIKFLTHSRLEYACYLLRYTQYSLDQIADTVGYGDSASFAHRFKKNYGLSPGRWRKEQTNTVQFNGIESGEES
jgi:AraC-like DNA-binding protein